MGKPITEAEHAIIRDNALDGLSALDVVKKLAAAGFTRTRSAVEASRSWSLARQEAGLSSRLRGAGALQRSMEASAAAKDQPIVVRTEIAGIRVVPSKVQPAGCSPIYLPRIPTLDQPAGAAR